MTPTDPIFAGTVTLAVEEAEDVEAHVAAINALLAPPWAEHELYDRFEFGASKPGRLYGGTIRDWRTYRALRLRFEAAGWKVEIVRSRPEQSYQWTHLLFHPRGAFRGRQPARGASDLFEMWRVGEAVSASSNRSPTEKAAVALASDVCATLQAPWNAVELSDGRFRSTYINREALGGEDLVMRVLGEYGWEVNLRADSGSGQRFLDIRLPGAVALLLAGNADG